MAGAPLGVGDADCPLQFVSYVEPALQNLMMLCSTVGIWQEKNLKAERDQLRGYWEKLENDKARKIMSIKDAVLPIDLKEVQVNDIVEAVSRYIEALDKKSRRLKHNSFATYLLKPVQGGDCPPLKVLFQALCFLSDENFLRGTLDPEMQRTVFPHTINMVKIEEQGLLASFGYLVECCMMKAWTDERNHNFDSLLKEEEEKAKTQTQSTASTSKAKKPSSSQRRKAKEWKSKDSKLSEKCAEYNLDKKDHASSDAGTSHVNQEVKESETTNTVGFSLDHPKERDSSIVDATSSNVDATSSNVDATRSNVDATELNLLTLIVDSGHENAFLPQNPGKATGTLEEIEGRRWADYEMDDDFSNFQPRKLEPAFDEVSLQFWTHPREKVQESWKDIKVRRTSKRQQQYHKDTHARRVSQGLGSYTGQQTNTQGGFKLQNYRSGANDKRYGKSLVSPFQTSGETKPPAAQREPEGSQLLPPAGGRLLPQTSVWAETFDKNERLAGAKKQTSEDSNPSVLNVQAISKDSNPPQVQINSAVTIMSNKINRPKRAEKAGKVLVQTDAKIKILDNARGRQNVHGYAHPVESRDSKPPQVPSSSVVPSLSYLSKPEKATETSGQTDKRTKVHPPDGHAHHSVVPSNLEHKSDANSIAESFDFDTAFSYYVRYLRQCWEAFLTSPDCIDLEEYEKRLHFRDKP